MDCCFGASAAGLAAVTVASTACKADVVIVVDMDRTQAWLLLFSTETSDQNAGMVGCCRRVWGDPSFTCHLQAVLYVTTAGMFPYS